MVSDLETISDYSSSLPSSTQRRLDGWRIRTVEGFDVDLRSQVYHDEPREEVVSRWGDILSGFDLGPVLEDFENSERDGIGPYSLQQPWAERRERALNIMADRDWQPDWEALERAARRLETILPPRSLRPLAVDAALERLPKTTNMGLPWFTRDRTYLSSYRQRANRIIAGQDDTLYPFVLGWRGQPGGMHPKPWTKQRDLQMSEKAEGILGARYVYPIIDALKTKPEFVAWTDLDAVGTVVKSLLLTAGKAGVRVFSTDYSGYDQSIPVGLFEIAWNIIESWFPSTEARVLNILFDHYMTAGLLTPDGLWVGRSGGIASGIVFTGVAGTVINILIAFYISEVLGIRHLGGTYLGDDALNVWMDDVSEEEVQDVGATLNVDLNASKQFVAEDAAHYLQNVYVLSGDTLRNGGGVRPTMRALNGMLSYERRRRKDEWNDYMASMRAVMQLENCKHHPAFREFVKFVAQGDRRLLEMDVPQIAKLAGGVDRIEQVLGVAAFRYTSQNVSSLASFATTEVLRQLRS